MDVTVRVLGVHSTTCAPLVKSLFYHQGKSVWPTVTYQKLCFLYEAWSNIAPLLPLISYPIRCSSACATNKLRRIHFFFSFIISLSSSSCVPPRLRNAKPLPCPWWEISLLLSVTSHQFLCLHFNVQTNESLRENGQFLFELTPNVIIETANNVSILGTLCFQVIVCGSNHGPLLLKF